MALPQSPLLAAQPVGPLLPFSESLLSAGLSPQGTWFRRCREPIPEGGAGPE